MNPWRESFSAEPGVAAAIPSEQAVVREVPWSRLGPALGALDAARVQDPQHPDDWADEKRREVNAKVLQALQVPAEGAAVLGRAAFTTTQSLDPDDGRLAEFARSLGADYAIWARRSLGTVERVAQEPVRSYTSGTVTSRGRDGKRRTESYSENTTTYVPMTVRVERVEFVAFFVRTRP